MKVRLSPRALADLEAIRDYLVPLSPRGADNVRIEISATVDHIAEFPRSGGATDEFNVYRCALRKYRYTIFYRVMTDQDLVEIARIVHGARVTDLRRVPDGQ